MRNDLEQDLVSTFTRELEAQTSFRHRRDAGCQFGPLYEWQLRKCFHAYTVLQLWDDRDALCPRFCWTRRTSFPGIGIECGLSLEEVVALEPASLATDASCIFDLFEITGDDVQFTWSLCNDTLDETKDGLLVCSIEQAGRGFHSRSEIVLRGFGSTWSRT